MSEQRSQPDANRISVLAAAVLLAFALARLIWSPGLPGAFSIFGLILPLNLSLGTLITLLAAGLAATGMDWVLRSHPEIETQKRIEHWILPTLTTLVIGELLSLLGSGGAWLAGFLLSGLLLIMVFQAEYVVVSSSDARYPAATAGLTALSFALFLILAAALRYGATRLLITLPALLLAGGLVSLRALHLRFSRWEFGWALGIALVVFQLAAGLHYWPLHPLQYGLLLLGPLYALVGLMIALDEGQPLRRALVEPAVVLALMLVAVLALR
jgi:hypothetical protein